MEDRVKSLLVDIDAGDRAAFRSLFEESGPEFARHLAHFGVPTDKAEKVFADVFAQIWERGDPYEMEVYPSVTEWMMSLTDLKKTTQAPSTNPIAVDDDLWVAVTRRAYPESWQNIFRRLDLMTVIVCALSWMLILLIVRYFQ